MKLFSVIILVRNEEEHLPSTNESSVNTLCAACIPYEMVGVDDGARDRT